MAVINRQSQNLCEEFSNELKATCHYPGANHRVMETQLAVKTLTSAEALGMQRPVSRHRSLMGPRPGQYFAARSGPWPFTVVGQPMRRPQRPSLSSIRKHRRGGDGPLRRLLSSSVQSKEPADDFMQSEADHAFYRWSEGPGNEAALVWCSSCSH
jgi:hypothetical protein